MKGVSRRGNSISFGRYALQALEPTWITARQIEAGRRAITRYVRRGAKIWVRIFPDKPVTIRTTEHAWVQVKEIQNIGYALLNQVEYFMKWVEYQNL
ncbi:hypothetical protein LUZ62_007777 [Rhynchospora pubera]|uniref:50S ribosomal protein L16, chloroplastic n=1 Tax=Rhynchospora pubera TaxID=906938 RepID=A0AAV8B4W6_9POAL|nr:hypothetical protein LUZ62_011064 [Rhynchospora pubera]KAJ4737739.1 hypothetical protein LUZ62_007777 [Rhynchospora pubera]